MLRASGGGTTPWPGRAFPTRRGHPCRAYARTVEERVGVDGDEEALGLGQDPPVAGRSSAVMVILRPVRPARRARTSRGSPSGVGAR